MGPRSGRGPGLLWCGDVRGQGLITRGPKLYKFMVFFDIQGPEPYKFIGFGDIQGPTPYTFIWFGDIQGPTPYKFIGLHPYTWVFNTWFSETFGRIK